MPRRRNESFYSEQKAFTIFAFLDQMDDQCFVWKTSNPNIKAVFERHYFLQNMRTKEMFERGKTVGKPPEMYVLSHVLTTEDKAFKHCIAWTKYFMEHGYVSKNNKTHKGYTASMDDETQAIYDGIKDSYLSDVCQEDHKLFADYGTRRKKKDTNEAPSSISFIVNPDEYADIKSKAEQYGLKPAAYAKQMVLNGEIKLEDYRFFIEYKDVLSQMEQEMQNYLQASFKSGGCSPDTLKALQELCDQTAEIHRDAMQIFNKRKRGKRTRRK